MSVFNYPCHLYGCIDHRMHIEPPSIWINQKCMLIWKICCYFSFVSAICSSKVRTHHVTRDLFTEMVLSHQDNFNSRDLYHAMTEL